MSSGAGQVTEKIGKTALNVFTLGGAEMFNQTRRMKREQKRFQRGQEAIQAKEKADALRQRKIKIDKMRTGEMSGIVGGRRELVQGGQNVFGQREKLG